jgi:hypothetical protein
MHFMVSVVRSVGLLPIANTSFAYSLDFSPTNTMPEIGPGSLASLEPDRRRASRRGTASTAGSVSGSKRGAFQRSRPTQSRRGSSVGSRLSRSIQAAEDGGDDGDDSDSDADADDTEYDASAATKMKFWKENHPLWYNLLKEYEKVVRMREREVPFRTLGHEDAREWMREAYVEYARQGGPTPQPLSESAIHTYLAEPQPLFVGGALGDSMSDTIVALAQNNQNWVHTDDLRKGTVAIQHFTVYPPVRGNSLSAAQIMRNKLFSCVFINLNTMDFAHLYSNNVCTILIFFSTSSHNVKGTMIQPFGNFTFVEFICDLLTGRKKLRRNKPPFCLRFFANRRIEPYVIVYGILIVSRLFSGPPLILKSVTAIPSRSSVEDWLP